MIGWWLVWAASAHPLAPIGIDVTVDDPAIAVQWREPAGRPDPTPVVVSLEGDCTASPVTTVKQATATAYFTEFSCDNLQDVVLVTDVGTQRGVVTVRREGRFGRSVVTGHARQSLQVDAGRGVSAFAMLGVEHLLGGPDHLLLVLGLVFLVKGIGLLKAITAFTVGHSLTLGLTSLGWLRSSGSWAETLIAASLVWLAAELVAEHQEPGSSPISSRPGWLCAGIGLVHGLGFAAALSGAGLPKDEIVPALFGFNLGLEIGQLLAVLPLAIVLRLTGGRRWRPAAAAVVGLAGAYWFWERLLQ